MPVFVSSGRGRFACVLSTQTAPNCSSPLRLRVWPSERLPVRVCSALHVESECWPGRARPTAPRLESGVRVGGALFYVASPLCLARLVSSSVQSTFNMRAFGLQSCTS